MLFTDVLKENKDFSRCYKSDHVSCSFLTCYFRKNKSPYNRMGITVGKKIGKAVERNRAKRIIRAAYRLCEKDFPIGIDVVFVARQDIKDKKTDDIVGFFKNRAVKAVNRTLKDGSSSSSRSKCGRTDKSNKIGNKKL